MVLADDNFATLRAAIEEGRRVYDNLVKALAFVLPTTSVGQALIIAVAVLVFPLRGGEPQLPVEPVQILWINLIVAVALALPLALEAPEPNLMDRPPRGRGTGLLDRPLLARGADADCRSPWIVLDRTRPSAHSRCRRAARARARPNDSGNRSRADAGPLPAHLPVAHQAQPRDRPLVQPGRLCRIATVLVLQVLFVGLASYAGPLRLSAARRSGHRLGRGRFAAHPARHLA